MKESAQSHDDPAVEPGGREPGPDGLGLATSEVRLAPHRAAWMAHGEAECAAVRALLGGLALEVVHVGSTAVPGLEAKPIIDIAACVHDSVPVDEVVGALQTVGAYTYEGDMGSDGGHLFVRGPGKVRTVHLHVVTASSDAWVAYRRFHALLVRDADARLRYQAAKRDLAARFPGDRPSYTEGKRAIIAELLAADGARAERDGSAARPMERGT